MEKKQPPSNAREIPILIIQPRRPEIAEDIILEAEEIAEDVIMESDADNEADEMRDYADWAEQPSPYDP